MRSRVWMSAVSLSNLRQGRRPSSGSRERPEDGNRGRLVAREHELHGRVVPIEVSAERRAAGLHDHREHPGIVLEHETLDLAVEAFGTVVRHEEEARDSGPL